MPRTLEKENTSSWVVKIFTYKKLVFISFAHCIWTLIHPGYLDCPKPRGWGGMKTKGFSIYNITIFPSKSTKHGLKWKLTSLPICRVFDHFSMLNSLVVRGRRSSLVWSLAFGTTIFENASFFTYIGNMYIKWKLKTF